MHILRRSQIAGEVDLIEGSIGRACETLVYGSLVDGIDRRCDRLILQACQWIEAIKTGCVSRTNLLKEWSWPSPGQLQTRHVPAWRSRGRRRHAAALCRLGAGPAHRAIDREKRSNGTVRPRRSERCTTPHALGRTNGFHLDQSREQCTRELRPVRTPPSLGPRSTYLVARATSITSSGAPCTYPPSSQERPPNSGRIRSNPSGCGSLFQPRIVVALSITCTPKVFSV